LCKIIRLFSNQEAGVQIATIVIYFALIISAPWISREWGWKGVLIWVIITAIFFAAAVSLLE
jgi:hypothetical protein